MFKKVLGRSVGGTAIAGLVLAAAPVAVSPQITLVACPYPPANSSATSLSLTRVVGPWGSVNRATAKVTSGAGTVTGQVQFLVNGKVRATLSLSGGSATYTLPRGLKARRTHTVLVRYLETCEFDDSQATKFYSVIKAKPRIKATVVKARKAVFKAKVHSVTGLPAKNGTVVFKVKKGQATVRTAVKKVRKGVAKVNVRDLGKGQYVLKVRYLGNKNIKPGKKSKKFRVR